MLSVSKVSATGKALEPENQNIPLNLPAILGRGALLKCGETKVSRRHATLDWDDEGVVIEAVHKLPTHVVVGGRRATLSSGDTATLGSGDLFGLLPHTAWYRINLGGSSPAGSEGVRSSESAAVTEQVDDPPTLGTVAPTSNGITNGTVFPPPSTNAPLPSTSAPHPSTASHLRAASNIASSPGDKEGHGMVEYIPSKQILKNGSNEKNNLEDSTSKPVTTKLPAASPESKTDNDANMESSSKQVAGTKLLDSACHSDAKPEATNLSVPSTSAYQHPAMHGATEMDSPCKKIKLASDAPRQPARERTLPNWLTSLTSGTTHQAALPVAKPRVTTGAKKQRNVGKTAAKVQSKKQNSHKRDYLSESDDDNDGGVAKSGGVKAARTDSGNCRTQKSKPALSSPAKQPSAVSSPTSSTKSTPPKPPVPSRTVGTSHYISDSDDDSSNVSASTPPKKHSVDNIILDKTSETTTNIDVSTPDTTVRAPASAPSSVLAPSSAPAPATVSSRPSCRYGATCYRRNPAHRVEEAHPGDTDYSTGPPGGATALPECPFGINCYRRNPQHRQQYSHTKLPQRKARKKLRATTEEEGDSADSYDYNDPFLNDDSSDDYAPTDSGSDSEYYPSQPVADDEDLRRTNKEAGTFIRAKK